MDCCSHCEGIESQFDLKKAREKLADYRTNGPQETTRILVSALVTRGVEDKSLLDIGGGIGAIQHELFKAGISYATNLEASLAYLQSCQEEANRQGHGNRIHHLHGNFAEMENLPVSDIVTLERVICCYPDMDSLVAMACQKSRYLLGLVYPHEAWWVKLGMDFVYNLKFRLTRNPFRVYLHPTEQVHALVLSYDFKEIFYRKTGAWQVFVYLKNT
jgi:2-polyprenyl-3-methyl-5-hydroxy-6-metoxy-1,4-benzoquinol methylase